MKQFQPQSTQDAPRYTGISTFMRLPYVTDPQQLDVALFGIPYDSGVTYRPGTRFGPRAIRDQSQLIGSYNYALQMSPYDNMRIAVMEILLLTHFL